MTWRIEHGDCLDVMRGMADASVDAIVSDPPYGLAFMGKQWDHGVPGVPFWTEALRVAKPGAHLLAFGGTRTFHRLAVAIEDAGWEVRDTIAWVQGQGFPKSHNLPGGLGTALKPAYEPVVVARKTLTPQQDLATLAPTTREALCAVDSFGKTGTPSSAWLRASGFWSTVESLKSALGVLSARASTFTTETAFAMTTDLRILNSCLSRIMRACTTEASSATSGIESVVATAEDFSRSVLHKCGRLASTTAGATAIALPAERAVVPADGDFDLEMSPIIVARKPLVGTVAKNVETFGTGALNIDGCRIGTEKTTTHSRGATTSFAKRPGEKHVEDGGRVTAQNRSEFVGVVHEGRWPANVMLDEDAAAALDAQTGVSRSTATVGVVRRGRSGGIMGEPGAIRDGRPEGHSDSGGASRFFYVAKASRSEREAGLREAGLREAGIHRYGAGIGEGKTPDAPAIGRNTHPTVKPVAVMRWLCRLVTPPGGIVLDPFCGSGTTGVAAIREGFRFVGIEREAEYVEIARARVAHAAQGQVSLPGTEAA